MNAIILIIPLLLIRFVLLGFMGNNNLKRAAHYPKPIGNESIIFIIYQLTNIILVVYPFFLKIKLNNYLAILGFTLYIFGIIICVLSTIDFSKPNKTGLNTNGLYSLSRNPMYVGYFIYFLACVFITQSFVLFAILLIFQVSSHWLILSEERYCISVYGNDYKSYIEKVRRYI